MNTKTIIAAIAGAITTFLLGWLIYGILLMDFMETHTIKYEGLMINPPRLGVLFASHLIFSLMLAYVFNTWANARTFSSGFTNGLIISGLITLSIDLGYYAFMNLMDTTGLAVDVIVSTLIWSIAGGVIGLVLGKVKMGD
jgi:hypothetical protein